MRPLAPTESARRLVSILDGADPLEACTDDLRRYVAHLLGHRSPATAAVRYRVTAAVLRLGRPRQPAPVADLGKLLKACEGRDSPPAAGNRRSPAACPNRAACTAPRSSG